MKNSNLKSTGTLFAVPFLALTIATTTWAIEPSRVEMLTQLIERLGTEKAAEFMARLEQKHKETAPASIPVSSQPETPRVVIPVIQTESPVPVEPVTPAIPAKRPGLDIALEDLHHFDQLLHKMDIYCQNIYKCVEAFFNKGNIEPYKKHVQCFKDQLHYLRDDVLHHFPQPQTPEALKLFKSLENICRALESFQDTMYTTLNADFVNSGMFSGAKLGAAMKSMTGVINSQRAIIDKEIGIIRNQLRAAKEHEMLKKINSFYAQLNRNFDYGNGKTMNDLISLLNHRTKR